MQEKLRSMVRQRLTAEQRVGMMEETDRREVVSTVLKNDLQNLRKTMDELRPQDFDMAVECILAARRLYIMGLRSSAPLAMFLYHYLHQIFDEVVLVQNLTGDVFEEIDRIQKGDGVMSPLREESDICLCAHTDMSGFVDSLAAPLSLINALIVSLGMSRRTELSEHFKRLEGIWNAHSVYIDKLHE